jgi:hypothetical protein
MKTTIRYLFSGIIILFFLEISINAQSFKYGIVGGFDIVKAYTTNSDIRGDELRVYDPMISFNANGYLGYKSTGTWGISIELGFIQKGGVQKYNTETKEDDIRFQLNYIQIPLLFDLYLTDRFFVSVGPEIAYMINAKAKSIETSNNIRDLYNRNVEFSGLIGLNYNIIKNIDLGIRYNHGISYISRVIFLDTDSNTDTYSNEYNQYIQAFLRFKI